MKANLEHLADRLIREDKGVLLLPHVGVDGDALGSSLAISRMLTTLQIKNVVLTDEVVPELLHFIPESETVQIFEDKEPSQWQDYGFRLLVDCHEANRIGKRAVLVTDDSEKGSIDHHESDIEMAKTDLVDKTASSTA